MWRKLRGTPQWSLVTACWFLLLRTPHLKPSGGGDGDTLLLAQYLHEAATGEPRENTEFLEPLKQFARVWREYSELGAALAALEGTSPALYRRAPPPGLPDPGFAAARAEINRLFPQWIELQARLLRGPLPNNRRDRRR